MKTNSIKLIVIFSLIFSGAFAQDTASFFSKADAFFKTYVKDGKVAYKAIKNNPEQLNELVGLAEGIEVSVGNSSEYQAFWINGYNLTVIKGIVDNYPVKRPTDIRGFFDKTKHNIGGKQIVLNDIENKLLRAKFPKEARFHFVLVCAGLGCPPIINSAYMPGTLDAQLEKQTKLALNNPDFIRVNKNKVQLSQIFEWYPEDFLQGGKSYIDFVNQYKTEKIPTKAKVSFYSYNWTLNDSK